MWIQLLVILCSVKTSIQEYVLSNLNSITQSNNCFGKGCSSKLYRTKFGEFDLAIKCYTDKKRCQTEINFIKSIEKLHVESIPIYYFYDIDRSITIMQMLYKTLRRYLIEIQNDRTALKLLVNNLFKALFQLHYHQIVHGDLHMDNIMVHNDKIYFIDFDQSFKSTDFSMDFLRLKYHVLSNIDEWENLVENNSISFSIIQKVYSSRIINLVFKLANMFQTPSIQYKIIYIMYFLTELKQYNSEYYRSLVLNRM